MPGPRTTVLVFSCIASLSAGTNYLFSSYAPQLAARLNLSSSSTNIVGVAGNLGVYLSGKSRDVSSACSLADLTSFPARAGPFVGIIVDKKGQRLPLLYSAVALGGGYELIRQFYDGGETGPFARYGLGGLAIAEMLTGTGSSAALSAASNGVAKSFGPARRGTAMSLVMSCFGLSAFFYSSLSHILAGTDPTSSFLLLLVIGTTLSMTLGSIFIQPALVPASYAYAPISSAGSPAATPTTEMPPVLYEGEEEEARAWKMAKERELEGREGNITGWALLRESDFYNLFAVIGLCSGVGLMYINNVGTVALTLASREKDPSEVVKLQAGLVSLLSVFNSFGRLLSGFTGDFFLHHAPVRYRVARIWWLVPMASLFVISQLLALNTTTSEGWSGLALPTAMTGLAYGTLFGLMPVLVLERFGLESFSSNNGIVSLAPAIFGNICNLIFGRIYDSHVHPLPPSPPALLSRSGTTAVDRLCIEGSQCFRAAFKMTTSMSILAVGLAILCAVRMTRREREVRREVRTVLE